MLFVKELPKTYNADYIGPLYILTGFHISVIFEELVNHWMSTFAKIT